MSEKYIAVGRIARAHGIRGEVAIEPMTGEEERFAVGAELRLARDPGADGIPVVVESSRHHKGRPLVKLDRIEDRTHAEQRVGYLLFVPQEIVLEARREGEFFEHELVGAEVRLADERRIGVVTALIASEGPLLMEIREPEGRLRYLPFVEAFVREVSADRIVIDPPVGWEEL